MISQRQPSCCCSVTKSCPILCNLRDCSTPGFPVHHYLLELDQTHVHGVGDAIQPSHPLLPISAPALNRSQHQENSLKTGKKMVIPQTEIRPTV